MAPQAEKIVFFVVFHSISVCVLVRGVFGGMPSEDEASEELPPVTDSEEEKPVYTPQCTNLERWQVLPTKPGGDVWGLQCFYFLLFFVSPKIARLGAIELKQEL